MSVEVKKDQSIHPRVVNGRAEFDKVNTAAPEKQRPHKTLRKTRKRLDERRHARDMNIQNYHGKLDLRLAWRTPGSMKP